MEAEKTNSELEWFDNPNFITNLLIGIISVIIIVSQTFAAQNELSVGGVLGSIMNHNSIYLFILFYFIALKTKTGKKNFNYLNLGVIIIYIVTFVASLFTVFQSFGIVPLMNVIILAILTLYLIHSLLKNTKWWKEFKLEKSLFNDISNDGYFISILTITIAYLLVTLIEAVSTEVIVLSLFDAFYLLLFIRFIYLYNEFVNSKELKSKNKKENKKRVSK